MKKLLLLLSLILFSCSNELEVENMEMAFVELHRPGYYHWFDAMNPGESWQEFKVGEGPYLVEIKTREVTITTPKPIKQALHLRGKYGTDAVELELLNPNSFTVTITDPDPYAEVFRIYF